VNDERRVVAWDAILLASRGLFLCQRLLLFELDGVVWRGLRSSAGGSGKGRSEQDRSDRDNMATGHDKPLCSLIESAAILFQ
jgi:hypothetical protein